MRKRSAVVTSVVLAGVLAGASGSAQAATDAPSLGARPVFLVGSAAAVDASTAAPVAARAGGSLLFADPHGLPAATKAFLDASSPTSVVIVGGERAISAGVQASLAERYPVHRYGGANRQETAAQLAGLAASLPAVKGDKGEKGDTGGGSAGATGPGVPVSGSVGQVLKKTGPLVTDTAWSAPSTALSIGTYTGGSESFANNADTMLTLTAGPGSATNAPTLSSDGKTITITQTGFYELTGSIRVNNLNNGAANGERYLAVLAGSQTVAESTSFFNGIVVLNASATLQLTAGQTVQLRFLNHSGASQDTLPSQNPPRLSVVQLPTTMPS